MAGCEPVEELREDVLVDFLVKNGGRVMNKELVQRYKGFINAPDPQQKSKYRDIFKDIINKIAVVKQEDGEKYIILKKKYQHLVRGSSNNTREEKVILNTPVQASFEQTSEKDQPVNFGEGKQPSCLSDIQQSMQISQNEASETRELSSSIFTTPVKVNACEWIAEDLQAPLEVTSDCQDDLEQNGLEDGSGSMGSPSVALDPLEKEWLKYAAIGHLTALCDLLRQDPSLAMKKDFTSVSIYVSTSSFF
ncbi:uncharacterized protein LOC134336866 isoform X2 [Mobula hypostoma]|uniref:uncharacterized protein LOC134336866 isoform X2 n=1 Tax=Mobula hypostoma TaxID=723540 RepID=UPI002FC34BA5